ncbi:amidohydrolase [Candidatus Poribacteria bacterium]|nr:amidohydrolase [Candidatus Poribacteria bacterium]
MRIDCQSHVFPAEYAELLARNPRPPQAIPQGDGYIITYGEVQKFLLRQEVYDIDRKIRDMDAAEVDVSILSVNMPGPERLIPELRVAGAKTCNDFLAEVIQKHPGRFAGLACLPWQDVPEALAEIDRAVDDLGLCGIILYSHIEGDHVDAPAYEPIYQRAEAREMPIVLHPTVPTWGEYIKDYSMIPMVGLMVDHSFAMLRLILSGVLERHPDLQVVQPHAGGVLPYLWGRIKNQTEVMGRGVENITQPPSVYYQRVYLDTVSPSALAMRFAYDFAGPDRLLFGSDHPWVDIRNFIELIEEMDISQENKARIFGLNAQRLFKIG